MINLDGHWKRSGYLKKSKFYKYLKDKEIKIKLKDVEEYLNKQKSIQITKTVIKPKVFNTIVAANPRSGYQMDIMIYNRKEFNGYGAIIGIIDVNSRFCMCVPLKTRKKKDADSEVMVAIKSIMKVMGYPSNINTDKEFTNKEFLLLMEKNKVKVWFSYPDEIVGKNAIIERFWRTLAGKLQDYSLNTGRKDWNNYLGEVVDSYNNTYHSTVRGKPIDIWKGKDSNKQDIIVQQTEFTPGDLVRYSVTPKGFAKSDVETYSNALYKIVSRDPVRRNRWVLMNVKTNSNLTKTYIDRDLRKIVEVVEQREFPTRQRVQQKKVSDETKQRKNLKKEKENLESSLTDNLLVPEDKVRRKKTPLKYKDYV